MRRCPYCKEEIHDEAIKCKHCGSMLAGQNADTLDKGVTIPGERPSQQYDTLDAAATQGKEAAILARQYRIVKKIGEGGMGVVYLAEDIELGNRKVAIKVLPPLLSRNILAVENLRKEALTAINLNHPNIIRLYGFHSDGDIKFLAMEYIDGQTLEEKVIYSERGRMTLEEILPIAQQIAAALDYAHNQKPPIFHRDLKPSNVMIDKNGKVKLLDFGIAREMKDSYTRVTGQETSGTVPYMCPQQINGEPPNAQMDIYSFAVTLYECMAAHTPFYTGDIKHQILNKRPPEIADIPEHINKALQAALAKKASDRPATAKELIRLLEKPQAAIAKVDEKLPEAKAPPVTPDSKVVVEKIRKWIESRKAKWKEGKWKDFVISLYDDGCAVGLSRSKLERIRDSEKKAWIKAEEDRKAEEARIAEESRRAAEEAERKRKEAEETRRHRQQEEQLFNEIKTAPTIELCKRYRSEFPKGKYIQKVEENIESLRNELGGRLRFITMIAVPVLVVAVAISIGLTVLNMKHQSPTVGSPSQDTKSSSQTQNLTQQPNYSTPASTTSTSTRKPEQGTVVTNSIGMKLVYIPAGEFMMGSPTSEAERYSDEDPQHRVRISRGFYMGQTEVTQAQWQALMGTSVTQQRDKANRDCPLRGKGSNYPMYYVSWEEATAFCRKLSQKEGRTYRLPTEAEWEYACRDGTKTRFSFGDSDSSLGEYTWHSGNSSSTTHQVGQKLPNAFSLYDMHGNVWEWCSDWYDVSYYSKSPSVDPQGSSSGDSHVLRGGSWGSLPSLCRSADRNWLSPDSRIHCFGFRIVVLDF